MTRHPCRIITTSAKDDHLRVLWGEINNAIQSARFPLTKDKGGPLIVNHQEIRRLVKGERCPVSYVKGMVASSDTIAAMQGHHVADIGDGLWRTLFVADEASSVPDEYYRMARTWANRILVIGNTWPCDNFFKWAIKGKPGTEDKGGDIPRMARIGQESTRNAEEQAQRTNGDGTRESAGQNGINALGDGSNFGYHRRIIRIRATDSPNVRLALAERALGREPSNRMVVPGVKSWAEYQKNLATWDKHQQTVSLDAEFYEGVEVMLFPKEWLDIAGRLDLWNLCRAHPTEAIGIDPGEGGANTAMAAVNRYGVKEVVSKKTPNTAVITDEAIAFGNRHGVPPSQWVFDRGGGGKQHVDRLREMKFPVRESVAFGEGLMSDIKRAPAREPFLKRLDHREEHYTYRNRRGQLYGELRILIDPSFGPKHFGLGVHDGFAIPNALGPYAELRRQLTPIPLLYDGEGRLELLPKNRRPGEQPTSRPTLTELLGCSPDEADAVVLACHGMIHKSVRPKAGLG